jgi:hypothetical protein
MPNSVSATSTWMHLLELFVSAPRVNGQAFGKGHIIKHRESSLARNTKEFASQLDRWADSQDRPLNFVLCFTV